MGKDLLQGININITNKSYKNLQKSMYLNNIIIQIMKVKVQVFELPAFLYPLYLHKHYVLFYTHIFIYTISLSAQNARSPERTMKRGELHVKISPNK